MIDLDDLFVLYRGTDHDVVALRGLSLQVAAGERVVVNGPSGSGKSTLIRVVTAEIVPGAGRAVVLGRDLGQLGRAAARVLRRERIGIITQGSGRDLAPELTCLENVAMQARLMGRSRAEASAQATETMERFGIAFLADRYPLSLSSGEAQRVGVAAALAAQPGVIVADEPTGELDRENAGIVYDLLAEHAARSQAGLLIVTHDPRANRIADRVVTIRDGRVSSEVVNDAVRLIVDNRGWVRLPEAERSRVGIVDRLQVTVTDEGLILTGAGTPQNDLAEKLEAPTSLPHGDPLVVVDRVTFAVDGVTILQPTSLTIFPGQLTVLAGPSGSGKTTLLGLLAGLASPTTGTIERKDGTSVSIFSSFAGFAEQVSVRRNVELAQHLRGEQPDDASPILDALGIGRLADRPVSMLSGGERQRAGVARALVTGAALVLLDEPTSQLDEATAAALAETLLRLARAGRGIVCTSHDPAILQRADVVVTLGDYSE